MAEPTGSPATAESPPQLDEIMLAMDVVDTLRHHDNLVERELGQDSRDEALKARLREIYEGQGLEVTDRILNAGIEALRESRFTYTPPRPSFATFFARLWINRRALGTVLGVVIVVLVAFVSWHVWQSSREARIAEEQQQEITVTLPAAVREAGNAALAAASEPDARAEVERLIADGEAAIAAGEAEQMRAAIADLHALRAKLLQTYELAIVSREGEDTGVYRIPDVNEDARNYYIIVEAIDEDGKVLSLPIRNQETGSTETVSMWGVRVPEATYEAVREDKLDDGIVENNILGEKRRGSLNVDYRMDVEEGALTRW